MKKPNLFIVGAPRSGTTSLSYYLSQHPQIFFFTEKEPLFFGQDIPDRPKISDEKEYLDLFQKAKNEKYVGEKSSFYLYSKEAPKLIKNYCDNPKIVIMVRDPVEVMISLHNSFFRSVWNKKETIESFEKALAVEKERRTKSSFDFEPYFYREIVNYEPYIKKYFKVFGRKNVHVIIFEDMKKNPKKTYESLMKFLELNVHEVDFSPVNQGTLDYESFTSKAVYFTKNNLRFLYDILKKIVPKRIRFGFRHKKRISSKKPVSAEFEKNLRKELSPRINSLEKFLGRDLSFWKS